MDSWKATWTLGTFTLRLMLTQCWSQDYVLSLVYTFCHGVLKSRTYGCIH
ncbi:hypothetical protein M758_12G074300 [Ceratodon purpureus]|nr:hypothetical protein M758_12G074300 [Ceratodon purpureus]